MLRVSRMSGKGRNPVPSGRRPNYPTEYLRLVSTDLDDREAVLASYPDGDAVWEDLGRIRLWAKYQRLGNAQSGWTDLSRDECKRRAAAEYAEQLVAAGVEERVAKRQLLCLQGLMLSDWFQPDLTTDCWDQLQIGRAHV